MTDGPKQYRAAPYNAPELDGTMKRNVLALAAEENREFKPYKRQRSLNWLGFIAFVAYICAFGFYLWVRITKTLDLGGFLW